MLSHTILSSLALFLVGASAAPLEKRFNYGSDKIRGVNLGGWLVLEPWITPSIFEKYQVPDEYSLGQKLGDGAKSVLESHWSSWIQESDFKAIAAAGLNHVRIPVGYWAAVKNDGDPYVSGQLDYLDKAVGWANGAGLSVMIDLHGAPGSQNGFDNSGRRGAVDWQKTDPDAKKTIDAIRVLSKRYASKVASIEALNEPMGSNNALDMGKVKKYYYDAWGTVRDSSQNTGVIIHDAFQDPASYWGDFMTSGVNNVVLDTHIYQVFSPEQNAMSPSDHNKAACDAGSKLGGMGRPTVVGEWTGALTDCAKYLNGFGKGARYDGTFDGSQKVGSCEGKSTGTVSGLSADDKKNIRAFVEAQMDAYEQKSGWIWWTWKTESSPEWDMQAQIKEGVFPQPLSERKYGGCKY